jgi:hypothetical protein
MTRDATRLCLIAAVFFAAVAAVGFISEWSRQRAELAILEVAD